jgi:hypothetical protein
MPELRHRSLKGIGCSFLLKSRESRSNTEVLVRPMRDIVKKLSFDNIGNRNLPFTIHLPIPFTNPITQRKTYRTNSLQT